MNWILAVLISFVGWKFFQRTTLETLILPALRARRNKRALRKALAQRR